MEHKMPDVIFFIFKPKNVIDKQGDFNFEVFFKTKRLKNPYCKCVHYGL